MYLLDAMSRGIHGWLILKSETQTFMHDVQWDPQQKQESWTVN